MSDLSDLSEPDMGLVEDDLPNSQTASSLQLGPGIQGFQDFKAVDNSAFLATGQSQGSRTDHEGMT